EPAQRCAALRRCATGVRPASAAPPLRQRARARRSARAQFGALTDRRSTRYAPRNNQAHSHCDCAGAAATVRRMYRTVRGTLFVLALIGGCDCTAGCKSGGGGGGGGGTGPSPISAVLQLSASPSPITPSICPASSCGSGG